MLIANFLEQKSISKKKVIAISIFLASLLLYSLTIPANRTESDDGYWYAYQVQHNSYEQLMDPNHLLFLPAIKLAYSFIEKTASNIDVYNFMCYISIFFSCFALSKFYIILIDSFFYTSDDALLAVAILALSFGFWRYSFESDIYGIANFLAIWYLMILLDPNNFTKLNLVKLVCLGSLGVLLYKPLFILFYAVFPLYFIFKRKFLYGAIYILISALLIFAGYFLSYISITNPDIDFIQFVMSTSNLSKGNLLTSIYIVSSNLVSSNWIYGFEPIYNFVASSFPSKMLDEEIFTSLSFFKYGQYSIVTFSLLIFLAIALLFKIEWKCYRAFFSHEILLILSWILGYSIFVLIYDSSSPEPWLMIQVPSIIFLTSIVFKNNRKRYNRKILALFTIILFIHNGLGILSFKSNSGDYFQVKSEWLMKNSTENDVIFLLGGWSYYWFLSYNTNATIVFIEGEDVNYNNIIEKHMLKGRIFLTDDVINVPSAIKFRSPRSSERFSELVKKVGKDLIVKVNNNKGFGTFELLSPKVEYEKTKSP